MKHHNDNLLCAIDVETSGLIPGYHEILQIAAIPLGDDYRWNRHMNFFNHMMRPEFIERVDSEAVKTLKREDTSLDYSKVVISKEQIAKFCEVGIEQSKCADMFIAWFEKLSLKWRKRILPVGHNLQYDMAMIRHWIGPEAYEYIFDPRWRDTMTTSLFWNDVDGFRGDRCTFKDAKLGSVCVSMKVENLQAHNAFDDAMATAECYGRMVKQFNMTANIPDYEDLPDIPDSKASKSHYKAEIKHQIKTILPETRLQIENEGIERFKREEITRKAKEKAEKLKAKANEL